MNLLHSKGETKDRFCGCRATIKTHLAVFFFFFLPHRGHYKTVEIREPRVTTTNIKFITTESKMDFTRCEFIVDMILF